MAKWEDIADSIRLDEVLSELEIDIRDVRKGEHWAPCPLPSHPGVDTSGSNFSVYDDGLVWKCFTCDEGGLLPKLVAILRGDDSKDAWDNAVEWLLSFSDGEVAEDDDDGYMEQIERALLRGSEKASRKRSEPLPFFTTKVIDRYEPAPLDVVAQWNITSEETVQQFQLKYDPEHERIQRGQHHVGPALIIPHFVGGDLVGYQERWFGDRPKWLPKYTNSDNFPKSQTLFNWDGALEAARREEPVVVIESVMTVLRLSELDYTGVATFGVSVTDEQLRLLKSLTWGVILSFDNDPNYRNAEGRMVQGAGKRQLNKVADALSGDCLVEILPFVDQDKGDLADLSDDDVLDLMSRREAVFADRTTHKKRTQRK